VDHISPGNSLNEIARQVKRWREEKGFYTPSQLDKDTLGKLMLVVTEVSEAAEAVREQDRALFTEEIADVFIRLLDITGTMGIDIEKAIARKMNVNAARPFRHKKKLDL